MRSRKTLVVASFLLGSLGCRHLPSPSDRTINPVASVVGDRSFPTGGPTVVPPEVIGLLLPLGCGAYESLEEEVAALTDDDVELDVN